LSDMDVVFWSIYALNPSRALQTVKRKKCRRVRAQPLPGRVSRREGGASALLPLAWRFLYHVSERLHALHPPCTLLHL
jgi:hypothetical protein